MKIGVDLLFDTLDQKTENCTSCQLYTYTVSYRQETQNAPAPWPHLKESRILSLALNMLFELITVEILTKLRLQNGRRKPSLDLLSSA